MKESSVVPPRKETVMTEPPKERLPEMAPLPPKTSQATPEPKPQTEPSIQTGE
jgi:hypothetical protein